MTLNKFSRLAIVSLGVLNIVFLNYFVQNHGYLPPPFFHNKSDTFMDFFNPISWISTDEIYSKFGSIYPPINFIILELLAKCTDQINNLQNLSFKF